MIDPVTAQKIKDVADIVDVVSDYVHLVRRGANYMGLCPFHNERTPSFSVNKARNFCYCFSCHKGGSPVNFIMEKEGISYYDALRQLAKKYGIEVAEREMTDEEREAQSRREGMYVANEWAKNHFIENLDTQEGRDIGLSYIYGRKVTQEAMKAFQLGYAIDRGTEFTDAAKKRGFSVEILKALGLTGESQQGRLYDKFRGRVIFPVLNSSGKTVAFGGRDLKGGPAKYINSPESEIYVKSRELYGIFQAKNAIVRENKCYLVEGYLDVIGLWQSGIRNVVASSGTALTDGQISLIHRFTDNVTLIYDGDKAGIKASLRGIDMLLAHNLNIKAIPLPEGDDPDSLAARLSPQELKEYFAENEVDIIRFKIKVLLDEARQDPQKKWEVVRSIVESIAHVADKIKRDIYVQECSALLNMRESTLRSEVAKISSNIKAQETMRRKTRELQQQYPVTQPSATPNVEVESPRDIKPLLSQSPLFPFERDLIYNCLKYGFLPLWWSEDENSPVSFTTAFEYVSEELAIDDISFTVGPFALTYEALKEELPVFRTALTEFQRQLLDEAESFRKKGYAEIAEKNLSLQEIEREENKLEGALEAKNKEAVEDFCRNYIIKKFASHENSVIRNITNEAVLQKHQLSALFSKNIQTGSSEERILNIMLSSLNVLKNGIIDEKLKNLMAELKNLQSSDLERVRELHEQIGNILHMRSLMAKDIGDRILCPQTMKKEK